jgi:anti-sigma regulatory factor (Ser/Thr protein kinase)
MSNVEWISSIYSAPLATEICRLRNEGVNINIKMPTDNDVRTYLDTIGFPEGMEKPTWPNKTYLPLIQLNRDGRSAIDAAGDTLRKLIKKLVSGVDDVSVSGIYCPIGELLDNIEDHSQCDHGFATVQYYSKKQRLDICIVDDGISIPGSFEQHNIDIQSDTQAVRRALTEGLSTKQERDARGRQRGTGLRTTSNIICEGLDGELIISSRSGTVIMESGTSSTDQFHWDGTVIFASLNVPRRDFNYLNYVAT